MHLTPGSGLRPHEDAEPAALDAVVQRDDLRLAPARPRARTGDCRTCSVRAGRPTRSSSRSAFRISCAGLFAEGSFSTAFVPVFTEVKETRSARRIARTRRRTMPARSAACCWSSPRSVSSARTADAMFAPGAALEQPEKFRLTADLLRLTFPFLLFVSLTALAGGVLNSFHHFALPAMTPVILNMCMIAARVVAGAAFCGPDHAPGLGGAGRRRACNCCCSCPRCADSICWHCRAGAGASRRAADPAADDADPVRLVGRAGESAARYADRFVSDHRFADLACADRIACSNSRWACSAWRSAP